MKFSTSTALLCSSFIASSCTVNAQQQQHRIKIIQLGDSYSSGNGFDVDDHSGWYGPKLCFRNKDTWGEQAVEIVRASLSSDADMEQDVYIDYSNHACSNSRIPHITRDFVKEGGCAHADGDPQYSSRSIGWSLMGGMQCEHTMEPQIDNVNEDVDIVVMTMGGNDAEFETIATSCFASSLLTDGKDCTEVCGYAKRYLEGTLTNEECSKVSSEYGSMCKIETDLINVFDTIVSRMKPGSKLIYNAYPHLATDKQDAESVLLRELVTIAIEKMTNAIDYVNSIYWVKDVEIILFTGHIDDFAGHEADVWGDPNPTGYLNELSLGTVSLSKEKRAQLYHPNEAGHMTWSKAFAPTLESVVREIIGIREANDSKMDTSDNGSTGFGLGWFFPFPGKQSREIEQVPIAHIDPPTIGKIGEVMTFDARGSYDPSGEGIASFTWDFGDGSSATSSSALADHVYNSSFTGYIHLYVKTHDDRVAEVSQLVVVNKNGDSTLNLCDPDNEEEIVNLGIGVHSYNPMILTIDGEAYECIVHNDDEEWDLIELSSSGVGQEKKKRNHEKRKQNKKLQKEGDSALEEDGAEGSLELMNDEVKVQKHEAVKKHNKHMKQN